MEMKWTYKLVLVLFILSLFQGWVFFNPTQLGSATLLDAKDVLENSRLSYFTTLSGNHDEDATTINITTSAQPDINTNHLFPGDSVTIGTGSYTVGTIVDTDTFTITSGLADGDRDDGDPIYVNQSATHTVSFTTASAVADGAIRISIPAIENDSTEEDSKPDQVGFDLYGVEDNDITCPSDGGVGSDYDFEDAGGEGEASHGGGGGWHTFQCRYSGSGSGSTSLTMTIGDTTAQTLLNPSPASGHTQGTADAYTIRIQNLAGIVGDYAVIDAVDVRVVLIEAVRVTATVEETLNFAIAGTSSGDTHCGTAAKDDTQLYSVPFGSLTDTNTFYDLAQKLTVSTNADDGYSVTVFEDDELGLDGANDPYIPDTACDASVCDHTTSQEWNVATGYDGFGYSLENVSGEGMDARFAYNDTSRTFSAKHFSNRTEDATPPYQDEEANADIMYNIGPVDTNSIYVCYRITVTGIQTAGDYYNTVTYIATPTF